MDHNFDAFLCHLPFYISDTEEPFTRNLIIDSSDEIENKHGIRKILSSKAQEWIRKKRIWWPWRENNEGVDESLDSKVGWHRCNVNQRNQLDCQLCESSNTIEASGLWLTSLHVSSTSSTNTSRSIKNNKAIIEVDREVNNLDYEILWEDLITKQQIGQGNQRVLQPFDILWCYVSYLCNILIFNDFTYILAGSCGTVYHGLWYGSVCSASCTHSLVRKTQGTKES